MDPHAVTVTLCTAAGVGVVLIALAHRLGVPSIALLLVGGVVLGPEGFGLIQPGVLGSALETVVALAVAVILFEGGLTLDLTGFRREPRVIVRMLTLGVAVTWVGTAWAVYWIFPELGPELSLIAGSLVIVTGPTVVSPLLRRIGVRARLHHVLYWEGVLVDVVGVFIAVLCYEWIASSADESALGPVLRFASRFVVGAGIGAAAGLLLGLLLKRRWIPADQSNIVVLATALLAYGASNAVLYESGVLAVIVAGFVVNVLDVPEVKILKRFKLELTEMAVGLVFVLLAAKLDLAEFASDKGRLALFLFVVLLVIRPLDVWLSTVGSRFSWRERVFLSWLAPRGIVAASMASLLALRLTKAGFAGARYLETLTYSVIATTVLLQGLTAPLLAKLLGLKRPVRGIWLLIGEPDLCIALHRCLRKAGIRSLVIAHRPGLRLPVSDSRSRGSADSLHEPVAFEADPFEPHSIPNLSTNDVEGVIILSTSDRDNRAICNAWIPVVGEAACYRWGGEGEAGDSEPGRRIWTDLPEVTEAAARVASGEFAIETLEVGDAEDLRRFGTQHRVLMTSGDGHSVTVDVPPSEDAKWAVVFRRRVPGLSHLVRDGAILDDRGLTYEGVVAALVDLARPLVPELDREQAVSEILDREAGMSTAIGSGVTVPHLYHPSATRTMGFLASVPNRLDEPTPDGVPLRLVFLLISPPTNATAHLQALAAVAQLTTDDALLDVLSRQKTRGRLLALLRERE